MELPPHARRIPVDSAKGGMAGGTTSACAENTVHDTIIDAMHRNYLRMRGEYHAPVSGFPVFEELPPHARRILVVAWAEVSLHGTTSACAENTLKTNSNKISSRNYLRMRGEYGMRHGMPRGPRELPPHARRILCEVKRHRGVHGTTSACAENTIQLIITASFQRNYLRMRGEYHRRTTCDFAEWELPPHARRIQACAMASAMRSGTTSACAENTGGCRGSGCRAGNYLRMRGEYMRVAG